MPAAVGVVGLNGAGKSTLLRAMVCCAASQAKCDRRREHRCWRRCALRGWPG
jgi:ABC-type Mn2+/Zn2+ transport system ATPase subunit